MLKINRNLNLDVTTVSNRFITDIMPHANGDYVKVYLFFLSISSKRTPGMDINVIADKLGMTSQEILDALLFWEEIGIVEGAYNGRGELISVTFLDVSEVEDLSLENKEQSQKKELSIRQKPISISQARIKELKTQAATKKDIQIIMVVAEQYIGHTLKKNEVEFLLYLYDECNFSVELIDYLLEYCSSRGGNNINYIKEVAFSWYENNIDSVDKAREDNFKHTQEYTQITKAFGINKRSLGLAELEYINKWTEEYPLSIEFIVEACNRTMISISKPSFRYADQILLNWIKNNVKTMEDIDILDAAKVATIKDPIVNVNKKNKKQNKFHNFDERTYNYSELEKSHFKGLDLEDAYEEISLNA